jgi:hypothetical protein
LRKAAGNWYSESIAKNKYIANYFKLFYLGGVTIRLVISIICILFPILTSCIFNTELNKKEQF